MGGDECDGSGWRRGDDVFRDEIMGGCDFELKELMRGGGGKSKNCSVPPGICKETIDCIDNGAISGDITHWFVDVLKFVFWPLPFSFFGQCS